MLTFLVLLNRSPSTRAIQEHLASLPSRDEANLTIIQIKRQERSYYRQLKVWKMILTSYIPALGMLTIQLVSLSKPVGPINQRTMLFLWAFPLFVFNFKGSGYRRYTVLASIPNAACKGIPKTIPKKVLETKH